MAYHLNGRHASDGGNYLSFERNYALFSQEQLSQAMAFKADSAGTGGTLFRIHTALEISVTDNGDVVFELLNNSVGESGVIISTGVNVADGAWHHTAYSYDANAGNMIGYVDGVAIGQIAVSGPTQVAQSWDPMIGDAWGKGFVGLVDDITITNKSISAAEAHDLYAAFLHDLDPSNPLPSPAEPPPSVPESDSLFALDFDHGELIDGSANGIGITHGSADGIAEGAYLLDGLKGGNYIALERDDSLFGREQFTVSLDFKSTEDGHGGGLFRIHNGLKIEVTADGRMAFDLYDNAAGESGAIRSDALGLTDGNWHRVDLAYDAEAGTMTGFVDGAAVGQIPISAATKAAEYWDPMIGEPWGKGFVGYVDDIAIVDRAISATEAQENYAEIAANHIENGILVDDFAGLAAALKSAIGGETILLRSGVDYSGLVENVNPDAEVTVTSLDPNNQSTIGLLDLRSVSNLTFDNLRFSYSGTPAAHQIDIRVTGSDHIQFTNSTFAGLAEGYATEDTVPDLLLVRNSSEINFDHNVVSNYMHGLAAINSENVSIRDNDFHSLQGDGMHFGQVQGIEIENNHLHDFFGSDSSVTHNDYVQFWTTGTTEPSTDIVIRNNVFTSGDFQSQAIFFRDQLGDTGQGEMRYQNVLIEENVIYNNNYHGITVASTDGATIRGNTLIPHIQAGLESSINVKNSTDVSVTDNVAPNINIAADNGGVVQDGNVVVQNIYSNQPNYIGDLFLNSEVGSEAELKDLYVNPESSLVHADGSVYGSELLNADNPVLDLTAVLAAQSRDGNTQGAFTFSGKYSADETGFLTEDEANFSWDFGDGTTAKGIEVDHVYSGPGRYEAMLTVSAPDGSVDSATHVAVIESIWSQVLDFDDGSVEFQATNSGEYWLS